jgi:ABC-type transporter Mla subunit MlaD
MTHGLFGRLRRTGDTRNLGPELTELLTASCAAATDLAALDDSLLRLERQRERRAQVPAGWLDALARCERSRDALVQRLLEAMTVLGRLQSTPAESGPELAAITQELQGEASAQSEAVKEIEQLLSPRHSESAMV